MSNFYQAVSVAKIKNKLCQNILWAVYGQCLVLKWAREHEDVMKWEIFPR